MECEVWRGSGIIRAEVKWKREDGVYSLRKKGETALLHDNTFLSRMMRRPPCRDRWALFC
jgi:hypothetical protein